MLKIIFILLLSTSSAFAADLMCMNNCTTQGCGMSYCDRLCSTDNDQTMTQQQRQQEPEKIKSVDLFCAQDCMKNGSSMMYCNSKCSF